ncbi:MAG: prolipoprotein diacylglyceryl transferase family protein [Acidimicrobiales bacterium]
MRAQADLAAVTATWCFDAGERGRPYSVTIRFSGRRLDLDGRPGPGDRFERDERVEGIVPGSGLVAVTTHARGVNPGKWSVTASLLHESPPGRRRQAGRAPRRQAPRPHPATWSWWRWRLAPGAEMPVRSRWAPLAPYASRPAVVPGSWLGLVVAGVVAGLVLQNQVLASEGLPTGRGLAVSLAGIFAGFAGARLWYAAEGRRPPGDSLGAGWCIQGFLAGLAATLAIALPVADIPIGRFLDASTPGLFLGLAIGRLGCFFTGCCCGRLTASRWGVPSSDRRVCARRVPTQLLESFTAAAVSGASLLLVLPYDSATAGAVFVGAFATYTLIRQLLLQLRAQSRKTTWTWKVTAAVAAAVVVADGLVVGLVLA